MWARFKEELLYGRYDTNTMTIEQLKRKLRMEIAVELLMTNIVQKDQDFSGLSAISVVQQKGHTPIDQRRSNLVYDIFVLTLLYPTG